MRDYKKRNLSQRWRRGEGDQLSEDYGWIFMDTIPLLYDKKRLAKQLQIETWLNLSQLTRDLGIEKTARKNLEQAMSYIV